MEMTFQIIMSNHKTFSTTMSTTNPHPQGPNPHVFSALPRMATPTLPMTSFSNTLQVEGVVGVFYWSKLKRSHSSDCKWPIQRFLGVAVGHLPWSPYVCSALVTGPAPFEFLLHCVGFEEQLPAKCCWLLL